MPRFIVRVEGDCFELYGVEADSEQEAMENWASGDYIHGETVGVEPVSAKAEDA